jgi:cell division inhibitor SepF
MASGIMRRAMVFLGLDDEELDDFDAYDDAPVAPQAPRSRYAPEQVEMAPLQQSGIRALPRDQDPSGAVTVQPRPLVPRAINPIPSVKVHVVAPTRFADAQEVGDRFKSGQPVIVNLSIGNDQSLSRRMVDFISGLTYALSGSMEKVADQVFLLTPSDVEVPAEEKRRLQEKGLYRP